MKTIIATTPRRHDATTMAGAPIVSSPVAPVIGIGRFIPSVVASWRRGAVATGCRRLGGSE